MRCRLHCGCGCCWTRRLSLRVRARARALSPPLLCALVRSCVRVRMRTCMRVCMCLHVGVRPTQDGLAVPAHANKQTRAYDLASASSCTASIALACRCTPSPCPLTAPSPRPPRTPPPRPGATSLRGPWTQASATARSPTSTWRSWATSSRWLWRQAMGMGMAMAMGMGRPCVKEGNGGGAWARAMQGVPTSGGISCHPMQMAFAISPRCM